MRSCTWRWSIQDPAGEKRGILWGTVWSDEWSADQIWRAGPRGSVL